MKFGINIFVSHPQKPSVAEQIAAFARCGFAGFFLGSGIPEPYENIPQWAALAKEQGIAFDAVHAPIKYGERNVDDLWRGYAEGEFYRSELKRLMDLCAQGGVQKMILHVAYKVPAPAISAEGLHSFRELEEYAKARQIHLCYENCKHTDYLAAVLQSADPFHGFCYDSGHHYCYTPNDPLLELFGDRLLYTHLHDNFGGEQDLHLLPGDGEIDWAALLPQLRGLDRVNLELSCTHREEYQAENFENFIKSVWRSINELFL